MTVYANPGEFFEATVEGFASGLTGTVGVRLLDVNEAAILPRTTAGIAELFPGSGAYGVTLAAPIVAGSYTIAWDDTQPGAGHNAVEDLQVITNTVVQVTSGDKGMSSSQILDDVLGNPLRFEDDMRARGLRALNLRYAHLWDMEDWTFRFGTVTVPVASSPVPGLPEDFGIPVYVWDSSSWPLTYLNENDFVMYSASGSSGLPTYWTVMANQLYVYPVGDTLTVYYRKRFLPLVDSSDIPLLPSEYHLALVHGARAELLAVSSDPTAHQMEEQWQADIEAMKREYLADALGQPNYWANDYWAVSSAP